MLYMAAASFGVGAWKSWEKVSAQRKKMWGFPWKLLWGKSFWRMKITGASFKTMQGQGMYIYEWKGLWEEAHGIRLGEVAASWQKSHLPEDVGKLFLKSFTSTLYQNWKRVGKFSWWLLIFVEVSPERHCQRGKKSSDRLGWDHEGINFQAQNLKLVVALASDINTIISSQHPHRRNFAVSSFSLSVIIRRNAMLRLSQCTQSITY